MPSHSEVNVAVRYRQVFGRSGTEASGLKADIQLVLCRRNFLTDYDQLAAVSNPETHSANMAVSSFKVVSDSGNFFIIIH